jgi:tryptophanyl-tRNA synthetase
MFKSQPIDPVGDAERVRRIGCGGSAGSSELLERFIRRGIVFSHRDLHPFLDSVEAGRPTYLYTGRGPSASSMHIGHLVPFLLCRSLQIAFSSNSGGAKRKPLPLVIQITDDEKFLFRDLKFSDLDRLSNENIKDIIACGGFDKESTFIFRNTRYFGEMYATVLQIQRCMTTNAVQNTFGFGGSDNVGKLSFAATQAAPGFATAFPRVLGPKFLEQISKQSVSKWPTTLIPAAADQDPFFLLTRNNCCGPLKQPKPSLVHATFLPGLRGAGHKMSSSGDASEVILLSDDAATVKRKLRGAFSGGRATLQELQEKGANLDVDVAYQYLRYFLEDEAEFQSITREYGGGKMSTGAVKDRAADCVSAVLEQFRAARAKVSDADVEDFQAVRCITN